MKKYRSAVAVLVLKKDSDGSARILLVHKPRKSDAWQLPQGGIEEGETPEVAALRELNEEAGLLLAVPVQMSAHTYCYDFPPEFLARYNPVNAGQKLCFVALEAPDDSVVKVDHDEVDDFRWVLPEELERYNPRKEYVEVILRVLEERMRGIRR
ncbi:MAG: NUDIX domain-containing protein [Candidatus Peribacteraceae bacterium]|nr:NUDIX domain-containing protein [Candidatus Peribacteraceae bacterium]